jgi:hypothetical protein
MLAQPDRLTDELTTSVFPFVLGDSLEVKIRVLWALSNPSGRLYSVKEQGGYEVRPPGGREYGWNGAKPFSIRDRLHAIVHDFNDFSLTISEVNQYARQQIHTHNESVSTLKPCSGIKPNL